MVSRGARCGLVVVLAAVMAAAVYGQPVTVTPLAPPVAPHQAPGASPVPTPSPSPVVPLGAVFPVFVPFPEACSGVPSIGPTNNPALNCILALQPTNPAAQSLPALLSLVQGLGKK